MLKFICPIAFLAASARAATINIAAIGDWYAAISSAVDGDELVFPNGTFSLSTPLFFNKSVIIRGSGSTTFLVPDAASTIFQSTPLVDFRLTQLNFSVADGSSPPYALTTPLLVRKDPTLAVQGSNTTSLFNLTINGINTLASTAAARTGNIINVPSIGGWLAAISSAVDGDILVVPNGTFSLLTPLIVDKAITIRGSGSTSFILPNQGSPVFDTTSLIDFTLDELSFSVIGASFSCSLDTPVPLQGIVGTQGPSTTAGYLSLSIDNVCGPTVPLSTAAAGNMITSVADWNTVIGDAVDGDELIFANGTFLLSTPLVIDKAITISGSGSTTFVVPNATSPVFVTTSLIDFKFANFRVSVEGASTSCALATPLPLQGNFSVAVQEPSITAGNVNLNIDAGYWYYTRSVRDAYFGNCRVSEDFNSTAINYYQFTLESNCHGYIHMKMRFSRITNCGFTSSTLGRFAMNRGLVRVAYRETVVGIRSTTGRNGTAVVRFAVVLDRQQSVIATITTAYPDPSVDIESIITLVDVAINGTNVSQVVIRVTTPYPYTIVPGPTTINSSNLNDPLLTSSNPVVTSVCNGAPGSFCEQYISYTSVGCDLSGNYQIPVRFICQAGAVAADTCPYGNAISTINFFLSTNEFCNAKYCRIPRTEIQANSTSALSTASVKECKLSCDDNVNCLGFVYDVFEGTCTQRTVKNPLALNLAYDSYTKGECELNAGVLFTLDILLRTNNSYVVDRPSNLFGLGDDSFWTIRIWTNTSGIFVRDAQIVDMSRTSDGNCTPYEKPPTPTGSFRAFDVQPVGSIDFVLPVTASLSCASALDNGDIVTLNFTVYVDYIDSIARRRRRTEDRVVRRDTKEGYVNGIFNSVYTEKDLSASTEPVSTSSSSKYVIVAVSGILVLLCLCCCCGAVGFLLYRRNRKQREKREVLAATQSFVTSSVGMPMPPQDMKAYDMRR